MVLYLLLILLLALHGASFVFRGFHNDYISLQRIQPIKGIFVLLIFASHFITYVNLSGPLHDFYFFVRRFLGQLVVVPFLFYSGYGLVLSFEKKGTGYLRRFPVSRLLKVIFQMQCAVLLFAVVQYLRGWSGLTLQRLLLSLLGWGSLGNSNWYIFAVVFLYAATFASFRFCPREKLPWLPCLSITLFTVVFILILRPFREPYWYNTLFAYSAGCWYFYFKAAIEKMVCSSNRTYILILVLTTELFFLLHRYWGNLAVYELTSVFFALVIVLISMKFSIRSPILNYFGEKVFGIYILQRIPMILLQQTPIGNHTAAYFGLSFLITIVLTEAFNRIQKIIWPSLERFLLKLSRMEETSA